MSAKPSPVLLREMSDEGVLRALMDAPRGTRAQLSVLSGLSKPTVAESIRRLAELGLVADTGERTTGRGGVGTYYALTESAGAALAIAIGPDGIIAELLGPDGTVRTRVVETVERPTSPAVVKRLLSTVVRAALRNVHPAPVRVAVVSVADPVDRATGQLVQLPDSPFLIGELSPPAILTPLVDGPVVVDNDVNWAARAEREARRTSDGVDVDDLVYLHLGEGLGCAIVADGNVLRGHRGIAGEIAHVLTADGRGRALAFTTVFDQLRLRHPASTAIDVDRLLDALSDRRRGAAVTHTLGSAICGILTAATAFCDPGLVVLGGGWGSDARLLDEVRRQLAESPRPVTVEPARAIHEPSLNAVRQDSVRRLRDDLVAGTRVTVSG